MMTGQKGKTMKAFYVKYRMSGSEVKGVGLLAKSKADAYDKAVFDVIPKIEGELPYSAWVSSVTYQNGNVHYFNTCEGLPY